MYIYRHTDMPFTLVKSKNNDDDHPTDNYQNQSRLLIQRLVNEKILNTPC